MIIIWITIQYCSQIVKYMFMNIYNSQFKAILSTYSNCIVILNKILAITVHLIYS